MATWLEPLMDSQEPLIVIVPSLSSWIDERPQVILIAEYGCALPDGGEGPATVS